MKIRSGFVSNSSSSSFVLVGIKLGGLEDIHPKDIGKKQFMAVTGFEGGEGIIIADITSEDMLNVLKHDNLGNMIEQVYEVIDSGESVDLSNVTLPKGKKIVAESFDIDHCSPDNLTQLMELLEYEFGDQPHILDEIREDVKLPKVKK